MSSSLIATFRLLILLLAAGAVVSAFALASRHDRAASLSGGPYACPMHPEVTAAAPGGCPICGMALTPIGAASSLPGLAPNPGEISLVRRHLVNQEVRTPAWIADNGDVAAVVYNEDLAALAPNERGSFVTPAAPGAGVGVVRRTDTAPSTWDASTSEVRFLVDARAPALRPGDVGRLVLAPKPHEVLVVPASAVLESAEGAYVLAAVADGPAFAKRPVVIGKVLAGFAVVLSGVRDQEHIVARDAFFLDSERRLHADRSD